MNVILENALIERLAGAFPRSPLQVNGLRESDAELLRLPGTDVVLALTTDGVVEEIESGLYSDPYLIGWMAVIVNASDLAAVGAEPVGILLNETLPPDADQSFLARLQGGIRDACATCGLDVLGGDTNFSSRMAIAATALGIVREGAPLSRRGCSAGHALFASGPLALGGAFALAQLREDLGRALPAIEYRPRARLREGQLLRRYASCCMDTSDGALPTLDELMQLNGVGFVINRAVDELLHPDAALISRAAGLPTWTMLAGPHGEFELLFTVPGERCEEFAEAAAVMDWRPLRMGTASSEPGLQLETAGGRWCLDTTRVRNLFLEVGGDVESYIAGLLRMDLGAPRGHSVVGDGKPPSVGRFVT